MLYLHLFVVIVLFNSCQNAVIQLRNEIHEKAKEEGLGLYGPGDYVLVLTSDNFNQSVFDQPHAVNVEFYNSFCGFCRRFAPIWKEYAREVYPWKQVVKVAAIDCSADENNDLCRNYEIMSYPTLRYFPPYYQMGSKQFGIDVVHGPMETGKTALIELLSNETAKPESWPNLAPLSVKSQENLFGEVSEDVKYLFLLYEPGNQSTTAQEVALDLNAVKELAVRQVASISVAITLGLSIQSGLYVAVRNKHGLEKIPLKSANRTTVREAIVGFAQKHDVSFDNLLFIPTEKPIPSSPSTDLSSFDDISRMQEAEIVEHVKNHRGTVFQADLEAAIKYSIYHELVKFKDLNGEQLTALQRYLDILEKYSPLGHNGNLFLQELNKYVKHTSHFTGKELSDKIYEFDNKHQPIYSSKRWVGCQGSKSELRGYSCGLWTLFHYLTVRAANSDATNDPLEVLRAIHGYAKHYFGCTHCSEHFQEMAERRNIWQVGSKNEAVLWLWEAHNEVNRRLAGDNTEDPAFPKVQFPTEEMCELCHRPQPDFPSEPSIHNNESNQPIAWNREEVLFYLRRINSPFNISRFGVDDEKVLVEPLPNVKSERLVYNRPFSDTDIRMSLYIYAFCILIIVIAMKLILQRGNRRKKFITDFMNKI